MVNEIMVKKELSTGVNWADKEREGAGELRVTLHKENELVGTVQF